MRRCNLVKTKKKTQQNKQKATTHKIMSQDGSCVCKDVYKPNMVHVCMHVKHW